jgi:predicted DNA-binding protein (MmcQ/YjbR family)
MNVDAIREYCLAFADCTENLQWGADLCFKVRGKIFVVLSLESVPQGMCFKCTPEKFAELCEYEDIIPAPYVGRYKWVMLQRLDVLRDGELKDLIRQSYEMVAAKVRTKATSTAKSKGSNHRAQSEQKPKNRRGKT